MSQFEIFLNRLEARLRLLIEGDGAHDGFPPRLHRQLERELIRTMRTEARKQPSRAALPNLALTAPDQYTLVLPAIEAQILLTHPTELDRLTRKLENFASQSGIAFFCTPLLRVVADPQSMAMHILTDFSQPGVGDSSTYQMESPLDPSNIVAPDRLPNAFLIVNGLSTFSVIAPVVNIGRDPANHLQLDDPQISHQHAQLRFIQGRFVIFDLDSRSGTFVNGVPVSSHALKPGDVIQLANLPLVFGLEEEANTGQTQELPADPPHPEVL